MHGVGEMIKVDGRKIIGNWIKGTLQGKSLVIKPDGSEEKVTWRDGIQLIDKAKAISQGRTWTGGSAFNVALVAAAVGCGIGALMAKD